MVWQGRACDSLVPQLPHRFHLLLTELHPVGSHIVGLRHCTRYHSLCNLLHISARDVTMNEIVMQLCWADKVLLNAHILDIASSKASTLSDAPKKT